MLWFLFSCTYVFLPKERKKTQTSCYIMFSAVWEKRPISASTGSRAVVLLFHQVKKKISERKTKSNIQSCREILLGKKKDKLYYCFDMNSLTSTVVVLLCSWTGQQWKTYRAECGRSPNPVLYLATALNKLLLILLIKPVPRS